MARYINRWTGWECAKPYGMANIYPSKGTFMNPVTIVLPPYKSFSFFVFSHSVSLCPKGRAIINTESPVLQLCPGACWERWVTETLCRSSDSLLEGDFKCPLLSFPLLSLPLLFFSLLSSPLLFFLSSPLLSSRSSKHRRAYVHLLPLTSGERAGSLSADELVRERERERERERGRPTADVSQRVPE